ncbi:MAG: transglycosylase SLT domain-containing protein [Fluviicola sp.]|jgi:membrane-bound lytic murein transglycosylase D
MRSYLILLVSVVVLSCSNNQNHATKSKSDKTQETTKAVVFPPLPQKMNFAGQVINLEDEDIRERLDREVLMNAYYQSATTGYLKRANRYFPMIERILKEEGIPDDFKYLAVIESGLQQAVSPLGAQGFWQFMPFTAELYDLEMTDEVDERLHIEKSTRAACQYLKSAKETLGDWVMTTASYNRGIGGVQDDMAWQDTEHYFDTDQNSETGRYVFRLLAIKLIFENPEAYGYYPKEMELYEPIKTKKVTVTESIPNLAKWANDQGFNIKILRKLNPWLITTRLTIRNGKTYTIELPAPGENLKPYKRYL